MNFQTAITICLTKYAVFSGRAVRSEFWWFVLFTIVGNVILSIIDVAIGMGGLQPLSNLFSLATIIPSLAVGARRLHDIGKSGWWQLLVLIPLIGWIILAFWCAKEGPAEANAYGPAQAWEEDIEGA